MPFLSSNQGSAVNQRLLLPVRGTEANKRLGRLPRNLKTQDPALQAVAPNSIIRTLRNRT